MQKQGERWLRNLRQWLIVKDGEWVDNTGDEYHKNWGFTIYRTSYGNDQQWEKLLEKIKDDIRSELMGTKSSSGGGPILEKLWSLFILDARSDAALAGLDVHDIRNLFNATPPPDSLPLPPGIEYEDAWSLQMDRHKNSIEDMHYRDKLANIANDGKDYPVNVFDCNHRVCLVADEEVLSDPELKTVKCVDADDNPWNVHRNGRYPKLYWGWMRVTTYSLVNLWHIIDDMQMNEIAPRMSRGVPVETWDGGFSSWW